MTQGEFITYQTDDGRVRLDCRFVDESLRLTQKLIAGIQQKDVRTINEYLRTPVKKGDWCRIQLSGVSGKLPLTACTSKCATS